MFAAFDTPLDLFGPALVFLLAVAIGLVVIALTRPACPMCGLRDTYRRDDGWRACRACGCVFTHRKGVS